MKIDFDENKFAQRTFQQFMDLFIIPEVRSRQKSESLEDPINIQAAQIIFYPDGRRPEVRINTEVKAQNVVTLKNNDNRKPGDIVSWNDIADIEKIQLTDQDDPDCCHVTLFRLKTGWHFTFDFRYNKQLAKRHSETANEFYEAAESAFNKKHYAAFLDNLFSACELAARSVLLLIPDKKFREKTTHSSVHSRYNRSASIGNYQPQHCETYNKLYGLRKKARYLKSDYSLSVKEGSELLKGVKEMIEYSFLRIKT